MRWPHFKELACLRIISTDSVLVIQVESLFMVDHAKWVLQVTVLEVLDVGAVVEVELDNHLASIWPSHIEMRGLCMVSHHQPVGIVDLLISELGLEGARSVLELNDGIFVFTRHKDVLRGPRNTSALRADDQIPRCVHTGRISPERRSGECIILENRVTISTAHQQHLLVPWWVVC